MTHAPTTVADGRYELQQLVIEGAVTELWRAEQVCAGGLRRTVALKRLHPLHRADASYRDAFAREARVLALLDHPVVAQLVDYGEDAAGPYLVTEWAWGLTLEDITQLCAAHQRRASPVVLAAVGVEVLKAFDAAHRRMVRTASGIVPAPIVQRDLSPGAVVLTVRGTVKLTDFGLPRPFSREALELLGPEDPRVSAVSPELAAGDRPTPASDLYAVGALLWEAIAGRRMWPGLAPSQVLALLVNGHRPPRLRDVRTDVAPALATLVDRALAPAHERYDSATTFARALEDVLRTFPERTDAARLSWEVSTALQLRQRMLESMRPPVMSLPPPASADEEQPTLRFLSVTEAGTDPHQSLIPVEVVDSPSMVPADSSRPSRVRRDSAEAILVAPKDAAAARLDDEILGGDRPARVP